MGKIIVKEEKSSKEKGGNGKQNLYRTLGPISDLEKHLPSEWWKNIFNAVYLKTDGDVIEHRNTVKDVDLILKTTNIEPSDSILDLCCGQGRHSIELAKRGYLHISGLDRSKFLIRLARKRAQQHNFKIPFSEGDARKIKYEDDSIDCVLLMGNSFGYFEKKEDDEAVLKAIRKVLKSKGILVLDMVDGDWMRKNFEPRSWEWIDQNHLVCRERTLSNDNKRIVSREVVVHAEEGIITDQFYAERLYEWETIKELLEKNDFSDIQLHGNVASESARKNQDLGMMGNRLFITATAPEKSAHIKKTGEDIQNIIVVMGDPRLPDKVKKDGQYNPEDFNTINALKSNLQKLKKYRFSYFDNHKKLISDLSRSSPTLVLNLCDEGFLNDAFKELHIPAVLEMLSIPYTGAGPACLAICYNKAIVRALAEDLGIPVPLETYVNPNDQAATIPSIFPALLKPNTGDSSLGITQEAVVNNAEALITYVDKVKQQLPGRSLLIQEFLSGREFSIALLGNPGNFTILPILEVDYSRLPANLPKILSYESKWLPDSPYWNDIKYKVAEISEEAKRKLIDSSTLLFERLECRDYARFDFREDAKGTIKLLEVNPNPGWCWDGKMNLMAGFAGLSYIDFLEMIINAAKDRLEIV